MAVNEVLDKIGQRYPDVIGALVKHGDSVVHNLESPYDMLSVDTFMTTFADMFEMVIALADEGFEFDEIILDYASHSFVVRAIEGGLLVILAPQLQRAQLVKLQVGLGLFTRAITQAIEEEANAPAEEAAPAEASAPEEADAAPAEEAAQAEESKGGLGSRLGFVGKRLFGDGDKSAPAKQAVEEVDEVPLGPDGKPKKLKMYRGVAFYE